MSARLEGVKPGDILVVPGRLGHGVELHKVERVTKTQAASAKASFKIDSGLMIGTGSGWGSRYARIGTESDIAATQIAIRIRKAQEEISRTRVTADNLEAAEAFIAASTHKTEKEKTE